nr:hypothetical protein CFP56_38138 [Quercus suber]
MDNVHDDCEEYFVREINTVEESKARVSRLLQEFELSIGASANAETNHELQNTPVDRVGWAKLLVREMKNASNEDDAIARVSRLFEAFESSIRASAKAEINQMVELGQTLLQECIILRQSSAIQQELQKKCEERKLELQHMKQLVTQYQIGQRTLKEREALLRAAYEREQQVGSYFLNQLSNLEIERESKESGRRKLGDCLCLFKDSVTWRERESHAATQYNNNEKYSLRTCKNCKTQYDPALNHPRSCRYHTAHFGGETRRKFESVYSGGTMDSPDSGKVFQYWHCCGSEDPFDPGCTAAPHSSYDD